MNASELFVNKSDEERADIKKCMSGKFLFKHLTVTMEDYIIGAVHQKFVKAGEQVITQGDDGDSFYMVSSGRFEARVRNSEMPEEDLGRVVQVYEPTDGLFPCFGELSLMYVFLMINLLNSTIGLINIIVSL